MKKKVEKIKYYKFEKRSYTIQQLTDLFNELEKEIQKKINHYTKFFDKFYYQEIKELERNITLLESTKSKLLKKLILINAISEVKEVF